MAAPIIEKGDRVVDQPVTQSALQGQRRIPSPDSRFVTLDGWILNAHSARIANDGHSIQCQAWRGGAVTMQGGGQDAGAKPTLRRFVIQRHSGRTVHFDFRLEKDGVLKSWAVPKGLPEECGPKHLAIQVEDHPLEFGGFEGEIPEEEYGAGTIAIWDSGSYDLHVWTESTIRVTLRGHRVNGLYQLARFQKAGEREWLIFRRHSQESPQLTPG